MSAFISCFQCVGSPGIIQDRTLDCHILVVLWAWKRSQVSDLTPERGFDSQSTWVIDVLSLLLVIIVFLHSQGLADVRRLVQELNVCTVAACGW